MAGLQNDHSQTYRIIGIRSDTSRHVIGEGLNRDQASVLVTKFTDSSEFPALTVEHEPEHPGAPPLVKGDRSNY